MKVEFDKIYYLTQYASYTTDEGVLEMFQEHVDGMEEDVAERYLEDLYKISQELMPNIEDEYCTKVYEVLTYTENLSTLTELLEAYVADDIDAFDSATNYAVDSYLSENNFFAPDTWDDLADSDLRENGINAYCLYWVKEIDYDYDYLQLNAYENGFIPLDTQELLGRVMEQLDFNDFI